MKIPHRGTTLIEMLVALAVMGVVMAGALRLYYHNAQAVGSQNLSTDMEQNLRLSAENLTFKLRNTNYGVPLTNLSLWFSWVAGFTANPMITYGAGASVPDSFSMATCSPSPVAYLSAAANSGATTLTLTTVAGLNTTNKRMIYIDDQQNAVITAISGSTITIDTDPTTPGNQGTSRYYPAGTPLCVVGVSTYSVNTATKTLLRDDNLGAGPQPVAADIVNMKLVANGAGINISYQVTLTGTTASPDPFTNAYVQRSLMVIATRYN